MLETAQAMYAKGLVEGTAGNVSGRVGDGTFCLTPSSLGYESMRNTDLIFVDAAGVVVAGDGHPSSEKALHLACYRRWAEVGGVVHCHPLYASMFAVARQAIPAAIEEVVIYIGGDVEVCDYHLTGSDELGEAVGAGARRAQRGADGQPRARDGGEGPGGRSPRRAGRGAHRPHRLGSPPARYPGHGFPRR